MQIPQSAYKNPDIYMDNAASTRVSDGVLAEMTPYFQDCFANASSVGVKATLAQQAIQHAREVTAEFINAKPNEIYFTSGGTESDNWVFKAVALAYAHRGRHIITTAIEHHAVLASCEFLKQFGFEVTLIQPDCHGLIAPEKIRKALRRDTILISVMCANNEIGTLQPINEIGSIAREHGVLFHSDAVQAFGHMAIDVEESDIDLLSASGHKFNGPKGIGIMYMRKNSGLGAFMHGGSQEMGLRAGTLNTPAIIGLGKAVEEARTNLKERSDYIKMLRDELIRGILTSIPDSHLTGHPTLRADGNASFVFGGINGHSLVILLAHKFNISASSGSACTSNSEGISHVLAAIGLKPQEATGALRLSLSHENTLDEVHVVIRAVRDTVELLRTR